MRMRADWERNFKMLIDSPSKVWEMKKISVFGLAGAPQL